MGNRLAYGDVVASWKRRPLLSDGSTPRSPVIRCCRPGRSGASSTRRVVMPRWMVAGSISIGSPRSCTACRSGSAPPCPWPSGEATSPPSPTVELRSWMVQPDPGQRDLLDSGFAHLRQTGAGQLALIGAALGLRDWIIRDSSRAAIRAALPFYLRERGITRQPLAPLTGSDALKPGEFDHATGFTVRFLEAVTREAEDARGLLWTMEREWRAARTVVSGVFAVRAASVVDDPQPDLSRAELKALLVIAYYQPVTHAELGVILGREIPREKSGRTARPGRPRPPQPGAPHTFVTTPAFLERWGLNSLPELDRLRDDSLLSKVSVLSRAATLNDDCRNPTGE